MGSLVRYADVADCIRDYFLTLMDRLAPAAEIAEANDELQRLVATLPTVAQPLVKFYQKVWFLLDWGEEDGWSLSEEVVMGVAQTGFYISAQMRDHSPSNVTYIPYSRIGVDAFLEKETAVAALAEKEGAV